MTHSKDERHELIYRLAAAITYAHQKGFTEADIRSAVDHVLLHVIVLNLEEPPPKPQGDDNDGSPQ
jgi:hypothetical protein